MKKLLMFLAISQLVACGKLGDELNPTYSVKVINPSGEKLRCLSQVDGNSKTQEITDKELVLTSGQANSFIYLSCQRMGKGTSKLTAQLIRNDSAQETDECDSDYCIVSASGVTK